MSSAPTKSPLTGSVSRVIDAPPDHVWEVLSGHRSPVGPFGGRWRDDVSNPAVGKRFRRDVVHDGACPIYWKYLTVTASEPGRCFEFSVDLPWRTASTWRYDVHPHGTGSEVIESYELVDAWYFRFYASFSRGYRKRHHRRAGAARLQRLAQTVETGA